MRLATLALLATAPAAAEQMFHANSAHTGVYAAPGRGHIRQLAFQDMYLDFNRFISIGAVVSSPAVDRGVVYFGSMDGNLYALQ